MADLSGTRARLVTRMLTVAQVAGDLAVEDTRAGASRSSGTLADSITHTPPVYADGHITFDITAGAPYARFEDDGTGIYGPTGQRIFPKSAQALAFVWPGAGTAVTKSNPSGLSFFRSVAGSPGKHFFREPMPARWHASVAAAMGAG